MITLDFSDDEIYLKTLDLARRSQQITFELLEHLQAIEARRIFLSLGYGSLFEFVTQELGLSESAAYRRIQAMRLMATTPEFRDQIATGALSLSNAAKLQSFFRAQEKRGRAVSLQERHGLIKKCVEKSSRDVDRELLQIDPGFIPREKVRSLPGHQIEWTVVLDENLYESFEKLKGLIAHRLPDLDSQQLLKLLVELGLKKFDPSQKKVSQSPPRTEQRKATPTSKINPSRERIPAALKAQVWRRDDGCCSYVHPETKKRCASRLFLQIDHVKPISAGGQNHLSNLRLLCAAHNRWRADGGRSLRVHQTLRDSFQESQAPGP